MNSTGIVSSDDQNQKQISARRTIFLLLALSSLNPHVYLDTVVLLGSIAAQQPASLQYYFALGAISASFACFFTLTYGSRLFAQFLQKPKVWKCIDVLIALTMWGIAFTLMKSM